MIEDFINAIRLRQLVEVVFFSKEDGAQLTRKCAPMDYGPSRRTSDQTDRFHLWDYESDEGPHTLSLLPEQILSMRVLDQVFDPADFVTWEPIDWFISRNWGQYS